MFLINSLMLIGCDIVFVQIFLYIFSCLPVFVVHFAVVWHILDSKSSQLLSSEVQKNLSMISFVMHNVSNQFEIFSLQKSNVY